MNYDPQQSHISRIHTMINIAPELRELPHYQLADLLELQGELKDLTERNAAKLRRSITKHGLFVPFFVWPAPDGNTYILDGHQRKRTLVKDGHGSLPVPCVLVHADTLPEAKEKLLVISSQYGRITQEGFDEFTFDLPDIGELVHFDALSFEFGQDEEQAEQGDAEPQIDRAAELQEIWGTERGQLWAIGEHRLLCGDSTVRADVERVMGGEKADMVTDPPYGMDLDTDWSDLQGSMGSIGAKNHKAGNKYEKVIGDDKPFEPAFLFEIYKTNEMFLFGADYYCDKIPNREKGSWLVWDKRKESQSEAIGAEFELIWSKQKHKRRMLRFDWFGFLSSSAPKEARNRVHPTQKPATMIEFIIREWCKEDLIADPFAGSGTTLVACQNLNRRGRAIEISPAYCAVILQRMADAFPGIEIHQLP